MSDPFRPGSGRPSGDPTRASAGSPGFSSLASGTRLDGRYVIDSVIAAGGFGITYLARHEALHDLVAIKEHFPRQFATRDGATGRVSATDESTFRWALDRFLGEGRALVRCKHPNVVAVKDIFEANGTAYLVLNFEEGMSFKSWVEGLGRPPTQGELDRLLRPLLDALEYVHAQGLMHRDLAPDNILVRTGGDPVLIDFGAARQAIAERSQVLSAIIKSGFSPPEQYTTDGRAQGPWTDIYALAATVYRAMMGSPPPEATNRASGMEMALVANNAELRARYRQAFLAAIDHALRLRTAERPQSIAAWRHMLLDPHATVPVPRPAADFQQTAAPHGQGYGQSQHPQAHVQTQRPEARPATFSELPGGRPVPQQQASMKAVVAAAIGGLLIAGIALGGWTYWQNQEAEKRRSELARVEAENKRRAEEEKRKQQQPQPQPQTLPLRPQQPQPQLPSGSRDPGRLVPVGSGQIFRDAQSSGASCPVCPELVVVPAGTFTMGSPTSEPEREGWIKGIESPQVRVTVPVPFAVARYAVTFDQWDTCVSEGGCGGHRPSDNGWGRGNRPVIHVSWIDAKAFIDWLSRKTGRTYRLLTDAEREYVARAGTTTPYWFGTRITTNDANYDGNYVYAGGGEKGPYRERTVAVDSFRPNAWGLFNVHGNVWEWNEDCWHDSYNGHSGRSEARLTGDCTRRGRRGGAWIGVPWAIRGAHRAYAEVTERKPEIGFRVARNLGN